MATAKDFARLADIEGVSKYVLVRNDGFVVSENYEDAVALSSAIVTTGKCCDSLGDDMNSPQYIYCCIERKHGENVLVFSLGRYYLAIIKHSDLSSQQLADTIIGFLKGLT